MSIHHHGKRYGQTANHEVRHSQRNDKAEGRLCNSFTGPQCQNYHHITKAAANSNENFQESVDNRLSIHSVQRFNGFLCASLMLTVLGCFCVSVLVFEEVQNTQWLTKKNNCASYPSYAAFAFHIH